MKREDIEKKSQECAERLANIAYAGGGHIGQDDLQEAFIIGSNWRINSVWHDVSESPRRNTWYIAQIGNSAFDTFADSENWDSYSRGINMTCWAYIEDLLPTKD